MNRFVAVRVPPDVTATIQATLAGVAEAHDRLRWTEPAGWHVTLAFCGEVPDLRLGELVDVVREVAAAHEPFSLRLAAPGRFGERVLWLGVDGDVGRLAALGEGLRDALEAAGVPVAREPLRPHVTLARSRGRHGDEAALLAASDEAARRLGAGAPGEVAWRAGEVSVLRSQLGTGPARYVEEVAIGLGA